MSVELLLPAGSYETFTVAVNNGADAVYIGGRSFSARANAVNFSDEEIIQAVKYAHVRGVKVYVALNTLVEDSRLDDALNFARFCYLNGVDALIVQDLGLISALRKCIPDFKLNASTQMTIHNLKGVKAAEAMGFSRIVLSRELSREEIGEICAKSKAEIEVFAHGALCMSYSGQCLMSSFIGGRSGNRGACAQPCRLPYSLIDENGKTVCESKYLLSLKDLCLINEIGDLKRLGVKSLKIEGRMKNAGYVAMTAHLYDKYRNGQRVDSKDIDDLQSVFSRDGFTDGYYKNLTGRGMLNFDKNNDDVYKTVSDKAKQRAEDLCRASQRKVLISGSFEAAMGQQAKLCVWDSDGNCVSSQSNSTAENALNVALDEERIRGQITKTGGTPFEFEDLIVNIDEGISLPIKDINEMRRIALSELEQQRSRVIRKDNIPDFSFSIIKGSGSAKLSARALTYEQIKVLEKTDAARIYMPPGIYDEHRDEFSSNRFFVSLPGIERFGRQTSGYANISVSNFSQIYDTASHKHAGSGLNVFNSAAVKLLKELGFESVCLSPELNICQIRDISKDIDTEITVYGYTPVMTVQNCIIKSAHNKCQCHRNEYFLKDRKGAYFKVMADKQECTNVILNSTPVYMGDKKDDIRQCGVSYALMNFTVESPEETEEIFNLYKNGKSFNGNFTRGHFYRGV